jgi:hypothetical protein
VTISIYLLAIVAANLSVAHFGPSSTIINAFLFIGLDLTLRDKLHDDWTGNRLVVRMAGLIATGGAISYLLNADAGPIALASTIAFTAAALADSAVYTALRNRTWFNRANCSNVVGAAVDSLVFPTLAFGGVMWGITGGQFAAKVAGGLLWAVVILKVRNKANR